MPNFGESQFSLMLNNLTQVDDRKLIQVSFDRELKAEQMQGFGDFHILRDLGFLEDLQKTTLYFNLFFDFFIVENFIIVSCMVKILKLNS